MAKRKQIGFFLLFIGVILVFSAFRTSLFEKVQLGRHLSNDDFNVYQYYEKDDAVFALFTNQDETILGIAERNDEGYGATTIDTDPSNAFDYIDLHDGTHHYLGLRLNHNAQEVATLRIKGELWQEDHTLNDLETDENNSLFLLDMRNSIEDALTIQTLDQNDQIITSISL